MSILIKQFVTAKPPARPPPPCSAPAKQITFTTDPVDEFDDDCAAGDDPFDTTFVEKVLPVDEDFDFDPRADEKTVETVQPQQRPEPIDLLSESNVEFESLGHISIVPSSNTNVVVEDIDPFDTSAVHFIVQPKETEIKFLEKELLSGGCGGSSLKHSLSDPDFDPRAEEELPKSDIKIDYDATARRKSSLSLNISGSSVSQKSVVFSSDLLGVNSAAAVGKIQKPLTPYYSQKLIEEKESEDPFDTSFVPSTNPSKVELNIIEKDLLQQTLKHSLSDPDFDPRAVTPIDPVKSDLLGVSDEHNIKVLTPALNERKSIESTLDSYVDPFDTSSIDHNILPGRAELKLIENELLPNTEQKFRATVLDSCSDSQELGLGDKVLTPQIPFTDLDAEEQDPFDTSIANNLAPGKTEIKLLESELIHQ